MLQDRQKIKELQKEFGDRWVAKWLEIKGLKEEAEEWLLIKGEQERSNEVQFGNSIH